MIEHALLCAVIMTRSTRIPYPQLCNFQRLKTMSAVRQHYRTPRVFKCVHLLECAREQPCAMDFGQELRLRSNPDGRRSCCGTPVGFQVICESELFRAIGRRSPIRAHVSYRRTTAPAGPPPSAAKRSFPTGVFVHVQYKIHLAGVKTRVGFLGYRVNATCLPRSRRRRGLVPM